MGLKLNAQSFTGLGSGVRYRALLAALFVTLPFLLGAVTLTSTARLATNLWPTLLWPPDRWTIDTLTPAFRWQADGYPQIWIAPVGSTISVADPVLSQGQDNYTAPHALQPATSYRWRVRSNPFPPGQSIYTWEPWSPEFTFTTPGQVSWRDTATVQPIAPKNGAIASTLTPTLSWQAPPGSTHFQMIITPAGNEAASVRFVQTIGSTYSIPGPPAWYGVLPDTLYYWRVRVNNAPGPVPDDHSSWGPWSEVWSFQTPAASGALLEPIAPVANGTVTSVTPTLTWLSADGRLFYFEIQISQDSAFTTDPAKAWTSVYWETVHGGLSAPPNSYTVSKWYPLERGKTYYWRMRPAALRPGQQVSWSPTWKFSVR